MEVKQALDNAPIKNLSKNRAKFAKKPSNLRDNNLSSLLDLAEAHACRINHWYYFNGRSKAKKIRAACAALRTNSDQTTIQESFNKTHQINDKHCSLKQVLAKHRHFSFFSCESRSNTTSLNAVYEQFPQLK